jgi:hypothetical protein
MSTKSEMVLEPALLYIRQLSETQFWGALTLKFEAGSVTHIRKEENLKPAELSGNPRWENGTSRIT